MPILNPEAVKNPSPQLRVALGWLETLTTTHDVQGLASLLADDYAHSVHPASLGFSGYTRDSFLKFVETDLIAFLSEYNTTVLDVTETDTKVVLHLISDGITSTKVPYRSEIFLIVRVSKQPDGEYKINSLAEFVDSKFVSEFYYAEAKRKEAAAAGGGTS